MTTRVYVTGRMRIEGADALLDETLFPGRQGRLLFAFLISHRHRPMTRDELADAIWPAGLPHAWEAALNALMSKLRSLLKRSGKNPAITLTSAFAGYMFGVGGDVWIDREAAAEAIDQAEGLLREKNWRDAWAPANIAAITARQPFLAGEEGEWIAKERSRLDSILLRALDCLAEIWLLNGEPSLAVAAARESVAREPYREHGYRSLMLVHAKLGNRAEALRVYESCRALLVNELGIDPSPEIQKVYLELLGTA